MSSSPRRLASPENICSLNNLCNSLLSAAAKHPKRRKLRVIKCLHINGKGTKNNSDIIKGSG
jgi:hypothetical protein